ncbi:Zinc finger MYM-type protein 1 [Merluccius polli]|uniref:Zinc finger MYM-type protein 1 n=1 Tax=Merluccius polli TaxID=89951 RepID=A0AA47M2V0_MERPO|nr:Zinc finger MYM-type protein 1 [Merluccius polli]
MLECLAAMVKEEIIQEVKKGAQFSVLVDETKDLQKKEQMSFVLRYYYNGAVHESFLEFDVAENLDAAALTGKIIIFLQKHGLEYKNNLVGQGYDGTAVIAHCLNLVRVDSVKSVTDAGHFFSLLERMYVFMYGSYVHNQWLQVQREMFDGPPRELQRLSDTRWACRHVACRNVMDRLPAIIPVQVLENIASEKHPQRDVEARGILVQIDLNFVGCLVLFRKVLSDAKYLSDMLQSKTVDYAKAVELIEALKEILLHYHCEASFDELWSEALDRYRQTSKALQDSVIPSTLGQHVVPDSKHTFCVNVYYPVMDNMIGEIDRRFSNTNCNIMQEETVLLLANAYDSNIEDLKHELHQTRRVLERKKKEMESPTTLMEFAQFLDPYQDVVVQVVASCEQSFSTLIIKSYLRSTMTEKRLSSLAVLSIESKHTKALDLNKIVRRFAEQHGNRRIQLL